MIILYKYLHHNGIIHRAGWFKVEKGGIEPQTNRRVLIFPVPSEN